jgi:pantoate--beta-alanine ligase
MILQGHSLPETIQDLSRWREIRRTLNGAIGFVPTMGALHEGHFSLLERARAENDITVLSIYVNPTQFDNKDDLKKYPLTLEKDVDLAKKAGVDYILTPTFEQIYPDGYRYKISENDLSSKLCGAHRPGHFDGVLTVVMKLLNLVRAENAYFGEKDFQQLELIRGLAQAFFLETEIIGLPTIREADGLALSSRNLNLSEDARKTAPAFYAALKNYVAANDARSALEAKGFHVDYIEDIDNRRYGAVKIGGVRLIDNVER